MLDDDDWVALQHETIGVVIMGVIGAVLFLFLTAFFLFDRGCL